MKSILISIILIFQGLFGNVDAQVLKSHLHNCKYQAVSSRVQNRIVSLEVKNDTANYLLGMVLPNCNIDSSYTVSYIWLGNDTLDISVDLKDELTACLCYFELEIEVIPKTSRELTITSGDVVLKLSPHYYRVIPEVYELYEGDTINHYDMYGFKQGEHITFNEKGNAETITYYSNGSPIWDANFGENQVLENISFYSSKKIFYDISKSKLSRLIKRRERKINKR